MPTSAKASQIKRIKEVEVKAPLYQSSAAALKTPAEEISALVGIDETIPNPGTKNNRTASLYLLQRDHR